MSFAIYSTRVRHMARYYYKRILSRSVHWPKHQTRQGHILKSPMVTPGYSIPAKINTGRVTTVTLLLDKSNDRKIYNKHTVDK